LTERPAPREGRRSALTVAGVFLLIAAWQVYRRHEMPAIVDGTIGGLLLLIGLTMPRAAALFHRAWMGLAAGLGYVNGRVLLTLIYFFVVFPFGLASRLFGNDPLQRRGGNKDSYWIARARPRQTRQGFERSF